jgi:hypothetical protein
MKEDKQGETDSGQRLWQDDKTFVRDSAFYSGAELADDPSAHLSKLDAHSRKVVAILAALLLLVVLAWFLWADSYYRAEPAALAVKTETALPVEDWRGGIALGDPASDIGFIFYPGGMVDEYAYLPLLEQIARQDVLCVDVSMPFHLALLNTDACEAIIKRYPEVKTWYIGGHSLGGTMAAKYVAGHEEEFSGLVLLAAYPSAEIDLPILSIRGDRDGVLDMAEYAAAPWGPELKELVLEGANHAGFGTYGAQKGDGEASISAEEQQTLTAEAVLALLGK